MGKQLSGAQKRKKKREKEEASGRGGNGAVEAWTDQDMDGIGVASQGYVCLACASEIEYDRSVVL